MKHTYSKMLALVSAFAPICAEAEGEAWLWPAYSPTIVFDFDELGKDYSVVPTKNHEGACFKACGHHKDSGWWTFVWGDNLNPVFNSGIEASADGLLERFNTDFDYITNEMGWPRDSRADAGFRSAVFLYGSNGCTGSDDNTELGGWQSWVDDYPAVVASYYPVYSFDPKCSYHDRESQMSAMVHEGIHCIMTSLGARHVHWAQEGGNTWLQQEMEVRRGGENEQWHSGMGFLNAPAVMAPFVPIECYSGWLLDGSFGGPGAQGVGSGIWKTDANGNQVEACNWRTTLGGYQYGNMFFTFLGEWISKTAVPWIWGNCNNENKYILETIAAKMGDSQTRQLIMEYRAKLALCDMKKWSKNCVTLIDQNWGSEIKEEWTPAAASVEVWKCTPYAVVTQNGNELTPENRTTPGWSGANIVPLKSTGTGTTASVTLKPIGDNMSLQLCYRATDGTPVYGEPIMGEGTAKLTIEKEAQGGVIFAVVCNTDYAYKGDATRKKHHDYRLVIEEGISGTADPYTAWYRNFNLKYDWEAVSHCAGENGNGGEAATKEIYELAYDAQVPISANYQAAQIEIDADSVAKWMGAAASDIRAMIGSEITINAIRPNGTLYKGEYTANTGYWYGEDGAVVNWGDGAKIFAEMDESEFKLNIGNYPDAVAVGNEYRIGLALTKGNTQVNIWIDITIAEKAGVIQKIKGSENIADNLVITYDNGMPIATYTVPQTAMAKLSIYTGAGHLIRHIINERTEAGTYTMPIDLSECGVGKGVYLVRLSYAGGETTKAIVMGK